MVNERYLFPLTTGKLPLTTGKQYCLVTWHDCENLGLSYNLDYYAIKGKELISMF